jgi:predicted histone-like DNA-binding protein
MSSQPGVKDAPKKYYAKAQSTGTVSVDELAEAIGYATSLTDGDVMNVIRALVYQMNLQLQAGKIVKMEKLGTFRLQLHSAGADDEKSFNNSYIRSASIHFRPGDTTRAATRGGVDGTLTFKRVDANGKNGSSSSTPSNPSNPSNPGGGATGE